MKTYIETPALLSPNLSLKNKRPVYLKLENLQPTGSFKDRGVGKLCMEKANNGAKEFVIVSGGNAGLAAAAVGQRLGIPTTVLALETISQMAQSKLLSYGANLKIIKGTVSELLEKGDALSQKKGTEFIHPFDHPTIWGGVSEIVGELKTQISKPEAIVVAVGGGGLMCGICEGVQNHNWQDVPIIAVETEGASSLHQAYTAKKLITILKISSIASSLGATRVAQRALDFTNELDVRPVLVTDKEAVLGCKRLSDDHRMLVEPACGAALSLVYSDLTTITNLVPQGKGPVVVIVCGGSGINYQLMAEFEGKYL